MIIWKSGPFVLQRTGGLLEALNGFKKEIEIQKRFGGIRFPAGSFRAKIRHCCTNYDEVRDALTASRDKIKNYDAIIASLSAAELLHAEEFACNMPNRLEIGGLVITKKEVIKVIAKQVAA